MKKLKNITMKFAFFSNTKSASKNRFCMYFDQNTLSLRGDTLNAEPEILLHDLKPYHAAAIELGLLLRNGSTITQLHYIDISCKIALSVSSTAAQ